VPARLLIVLLRSKRMHLRLSHNDFEQFVFTTLLSKDKVVSGTTTHIFTESTSTIENLRHRFVGGSGACRAVSRPRSKSMQYSIVACRERERARERESERESERVRENGRENQIKREMVPCHHRRFSSRYLDVIPLQLRVVSCGPTRPMWGPTECWVSNMTPSPFEG